MTVEELIDLIADLPDKSLPWPVLIYGPEGWSTVKAVRPDEDRVILALEPF